MRRRLRRQRQMREALLLDLGALVYELHRQGRREPELLQAKAAELTAVDEEVRALAEALGTDRSVMQLVATGVAGSCENCGSLMSVDQRYCSSCGAPAVPALSTDGERPAVAERTDEYAALSIGPDDEAEHEYDVAVHRDEPTADEEHYAADDYDSQEFEQLADEAYETPPDDAPEEGVIRVSRLVPDEGEPEPPPAAAEAAEPEAAEPEAFEPEQEGEAEPEPQTPEAGPEAHVPEPEELQEPEAEAAQEPEAEEPEAQELQEPEAEEPEEQEPEAAEPEAQELQEPEETHAWDTVPAGDGHAAGPATPAGRANAAAPPPRAMADDALDSAGKAIRSGIERGRQWLRGRREEP